MSSYGKTNPCRNCGKLCWGTYCRKCTNKNKGRVGQCRKEKEKRKRH